MLFYILYLYSTYFLILYYYNKYGDYMKMNFVVPIVSAVLLGYLCASFIFEQYGIGKFAFSENKNIYFLQCGSYSTKEASETKIDGIKDKITILEGDKYYSYIGMTRNVNIANEIEKKYKEKGIDIYVKKVDLDNENFLNQLEQYDVLLESSDTFEEINSVLKTILATYAETVLNS